MTAAAYDSITALLVVHLAGFAAWSGLLLAFLLQRVTDPRTAGGLLHPCLIAAIATLASGWGLALAEQGAPAHWSRAVGSMQALGIAMAAILLVARFGALMLLREAADQRDAAAAAAAARRLTRLVAADLLLAGLALTIAVGGRYG